MFIIAIERPHSYLLAISIKIPDVLGKYFKMLVLFDGSVFITVIQVLTIIQIHIIIFILLCCMSSVA